MNIEKSGTEDTISPSIAPLDMPVTSLPAQENQRQAARFAQTVLRFFGIDRAIAYTLAGRGWSIVATPITLFLVGRCLRPVEQGFYYTFGSIIALNVFLELGLTFVLVQFASHEKAHLEWTATGVLSGPDTAQNRLAAVLKIAAKWYSVAALLAMLLVMPIGLVFFSRNATTTLVVWRTPWVLLVISSAVNLLTMPFLAIVEGCGRISHIASLRLHQSVLANAGLWMTLWLHGALFASAVYQTINVLIEVGWLAISYGPLCRTLLTRNLESVSFHWGKEVWPFQWRIAVSWLGGYFISQLFNPVLFATRGAVVAGQMGMSLTISGALVTVSYAWVSTKASPFGILVAKRQWKDLDTLFFRTARQSTMVLLAGGVAVFSAVVGAHAIGLPFSKRLLDPVPFGFLVLSAFMTHIVYCEAIYLRTHKAEPFLFVSIAGGILSAIATLALAPRFGAYGVCMGYFATTLLSLAMGTSIFTKKRREWHV